MERDYEIFECLPDGSVMWCDRALGLRDARLKLDSLQRDTGKEFFAMHLLTRDIVFASDVSKVLSERGSKRIFQIAYTDDLRIARAKLLRNLGYSVISVMGNESAKLLLTTLRTSVSDIAFFIVGHAAPVETRTEMVVWLRVNYPNSKILALNPPNQEVANANYNVLQNGPESWLPFVEKTISIL